jgi:hypothetical protein
MKHQKKIDQKRPNGASDRLSFKDKLKSVLYFLIAMSILFIIILGLIKFASWSEKKDREDIKESNTSTMGTIIKTGSMKGSYAIAEYFVRGERYERKSSSPAEDIYVGEHYVIIYEDTNPKESRIDYTQPIFLDTDHTDSTIATVISKDRVKVGFTYQVNGEVIRRFQKYAVDAQINKGETYSVEYLVDNPRISILKINK